MHRCRTPDAGRGALVQLAVDEGERFGHPSMRLASDRSEGSSPRFIQARYLACQSSVRGGGSVSMASASAAP
jgi:hypothetical protein